MTIKEKFLCVLEEIFEQRELQSGEEVSISKNSKRFSKLKIGDCHNILENLQNNKIIEVNPKNYRGPINFNDPNWKPPLEEVFGFYSFIVTDKFDAYFNEIKQEAYLKTKKTNSKPEVHCYALKRYHDVWKLIFEGKETFMKDTRGVLYVSYLLQNPSELIHASALISEIFDISKKQVGIEEIPDEKTGQLIKLDKNAYPQERNLGLDARQSSCNIFKEIQKLEAFIENPTNFEPEKREARQELEELQDFQKTHAEENRCNAEKAVESVRKAINRLIDRFIADQNPVLKSFGLHLDKCIRTPSSRLLNQGKAGSFIYEPLNDITWK